MADFLRAWSSSSTTTMYFRTWLSQEYKPMRSSALRRADMYSSRSVRRRTRASWMLALLIGSTRMPHCRVALISCAAFQSRDAKALRESAPLGLRALSR